MGGNQEARVRRDELEKALKPEEIARAQWFSLLFVRGAKLAGGVTNTVSDVERRDQLMTAMAVESVAIVIASSAEPPKYTVRDPRCSVAVG
jgi:hypothetical protein